MEDDQDGTRRIAGSRHTIRSDLKCEDHIDELPNKSIKKKFNEVGAGFRRNPSRFAGARDGRMICAMLTRRQFSKLILGSGLVASNNFSTAGASSASTPQGEEQAPTQDCDLLIKGGTVVDPGQNLHALLDMAVKDGKILELAPDISAARALRVVSAKGKIVTPGLIDVHVHVFE
jgi:hypothetical protein